MFTICSEILLGRTMSSFLNVSPLVFTSRLLHLLGGSLLVGTSAVPFLYKSNEMVNPKMFFICASVVVFITGLFNTHALQISKLKDAATLYRIVVYGGKVALLLLLSPVLDKLLPSFVDVNLVRFLATVLLVATGTWLRYYREKHAKENAK